MKVLNKGFAALLSVCVVTTPVLADVGIATISDMNGKVLVNAGEGFVPAAADMVLKAGDRIFVGEQSLATLSYEACAVLLDKPTVVTVTAEGGCKASTSVQPVADVYVPPAAVAPGVAGTGLAGIPPAVLLTTAGIVGVTCVVACKKLFGNRENSVSPEVTPIIVQ